MDKVARFPVRVAIAFALVMGAIVGTAVTLWRMPTVSIDTQPPVCAATFGNMVSCGSDGNALGFALAAVLVSGAISYAVARRLRVAVTLERAIT